ncbi:MAG TPA: PEP-CTERM sorting domain-containing protein [Casimicrobiaceae bacterium]|jgi:hypothetical protein|nr:PEP-CTERM sorting domain-containing protein [Casimicrobiaceae bacterium]
MRCSPLSVLFGLALAGPAFSALGAPILISNGSYSGTTVRDCSQHPGGGGCIENDAATFTQTIVQDLSDYQPGNTAAATTATNAFGIRAQGTSGSSVSVFDAATSAPSARQGGFANGATARVSGRTYTVSGYAWDGTGPTDRSVDIALSYSGTNVIDGTHQFPIDTNPFSALVVDVAIFSLGTPTFVVDDQLVAGGPSCVFQGGLFDCLSGQRDDVRNEGSAILGSLPGETLVTGALDFSLEAGRYYFLEMFTGAWGKYDSYMDAAHTVTTNFSSTAGLSELPAGAQAVPEPGTMALLLAALTSALAFRARPVRAGSRARSAIQFPDRQRRAGGTTGLFRRVERRLSVLAHRHWLIDLRGHAATYENRRHD